MIPRIRPTTPLGAAAVCALVLALSSCDRGQPASPALLCYVGEAMRPAMQDLAARYEKQTGQPIEVDPADSGSPLAKIEQTGAGDLCVCRGPFFDRLMAKRLGRQGWVVAYVKPASAVQEGSSGDADLSAARVAVATLQCSKQPDAAKAFAEFVASPQARETFVAYGFSAPADKVGPVATAGGPCTACLTGDAPPPGESVLLHCAAGIQPAVEKIIEAFTAETGIQVQANYAGSGQLIASIRGSRIGDLYMPGDIGYIERAKQFDLVEEPHTGCYFVPVILVQKGNPKNIRTLEDLARPGLRLALGNPEACAIGRKTNKIFEKNGIDRKAIETNWVYRSVTVNELGVQIKAGHSDAAIVWDAMAAYFADSADAVPIPPEQNIISTVAVAVLKCATNRAAAMRFAQFVSGERCKEIFRANHYTVEKP